MNTSTTAYPLIQKNGRK